MSFLLLSISTLSTPVTDKNILFQWRSLITKLSFLSSGRSISKKARRLLVSYLAEIFMTKVKALITWFLQGYPLSALYFKISLRSCTISVLTFEFKQMVIMMFLKSLSTFGSAEEDSIISKPLLLSKSYFWILVIKLSDNSYCIFSSWSFRSHWAA